MLRGTFQPDKLTGERYFRWRGGDVSRLEALADAVFALALTLLVVRLEVPRTFAEVEYAFLHAPVYLACFAVFLWVWYCHHQFHRRYGLEDPLTVALDGAILFVVLMFALPLRFVAELLYAQIFHGDVLVRGVDGEVARDASGVAVPMADSSVSDTLMVLYAGGFVLVFGLLLVQTWRGSRRADVLALDRVERMVTRATMRMHTATVAIGALSLGSVLLGLPGPVAGFAFFLLGPVHGALGAIQGRAIHRTAVEDGILEGGAARPA